MGQLRTAIILVVVFLSVSCRSNDHRVRVACVGDSITLGDDRSDNYPSTLQRLLGDGYRVRNFGVNGTTAGQQADQPYIRESAFRRAKEFKPNIVLLMLGTNDTKLQNWCHVDRFVADYKELIAEFLALDPAPKVYLCVPVPAYIDGNWINGMRVCELRPMIEQIGKELQLPVIDLYPVLDRRPDLFPDGVHPNPEGDRLIAETIHARLASDQQK